MNMNEGKELHFAIIPDGNRRWAKERGKQPWKGHEASRKVIKDIAKWCYDHPRVGVLTLWVFSTENWSRDKKEVTILMRMMEGVLKEQRKEFIKNQTRFVHSGRKDRLSNGLKTLIDDVEKETKNNKKFIVNLALDYGGKDEILRAINKLSSKKTDEKKLREHLDHPELPDIDIIVRTSGEMRTSNFFLWQSVYAEWFFIDKYFPDITVKDLGKTIEEYDARQRRFGG